ncbi:sigma-70 family RNA polymerase sigma factor [Pelagovum sp. HNIBRBA483]|uniref:sigma-70 family RNA polymerase sigma factor n=1 Tax=Pelagovum sp. HNIBRBA483 TaxID=3233341 RepID=UPI0034A37944
MTPAANPAFADAPDAALIVAFANGDTAAAAEIMARFAPRVLAQATRLLRDQEEAEDVTQEAFLRLWRVAPRWQQGQAALSTWLYQVTSNLALDRLRRRHRSNTSLDAVAEPQDDAPAAVDRLQMQARQEALGAALAQLPERQAQAVALRHLEGLANPQIAEIMEITTEAVESLVARGKRALATQLMARKQELGFDDD